MTYLRWPTRFLVSWLTKDLLRLTEVKYINNRDLNFHAAFNKTLTASEASGASKARQVSQPVRAKLAGAGGAVQADRTVLKQFKV